MKTFEIVYRAIFTKHSVVDNKTGYSSPLLVGEGRGGDGLYVVPPHGQPGQPRQVLDSLNGEPSTYKLVTFIYVKLLCINLMVRLIFVLCYIKFDYSKLFLKDLQFKGFVCFKNLFN